MQYTNIYGNKNRISKYLLLHVSVRVGSALSKKQKREKCLSSQKACICNIYLQDMNIKGYQLFNPESSVTILLSSYLFICNCSV